VHGFWSGIHAQARYHTEQAGMLTRNGSSSPHLAANTESLTPE